MKRPLRLLKLYQRERRVMNWKQEIDALIESAMAFARDVKRQPIPDLQDLPVAMRTAEQTPADTPNPVDRPATIAHVL